MTHNMASCTYGLSVVITTGNIQRRTSIPSGPYLSGLPTKILLTFILSIRRATYLRTNLPLLCILILIQRAYRLWIYSSSSFLASVSGFNSVTITFSDLHIIYHTIYHIYHIIYHIISYRIISYHTISYIIYHIISIISFHTIYHVITYHIIYHIMS